MALRTVRGVACAGVVAVTLALAGCSGAPVKAGSAAIVEGQRISVASLNSTVDSLLAAQSGAGAPATPAPEVYRDQLRRKIVAALVDRAAATTGVSVTDGEVAARMRQYVDQAGGRSQLESQAAGAGIAPDDLPGFIRESLLTEKIGAALVPDARGDAGKAKQQKATSDLLVKTSGQLDVTVNPRYGSWEPSQGSIVPSADGFVAPNSPPAAPPTPTG